jgi:hypothetical protein
LSEFRNACEWHKANDADVFMDGPVWSILAAGNGTPTSSSSVRAKRTRQPVTGKVKGKGKRIGQTTTSALVDTAASK